MYFFLLYVDLFSVVVLCSLLFYFMDRIWFCCCFWFYCVIDLVDILFVTDIIVVLELFELAERPGVVS